MQGKIYQINIKPETARERGLPKKPVKLAVVSYNGLGWDFNRYRQEKHHGRLDRALLLMPIETIEQLNEEGWPVQPGDIGENLTTEGIPYAELEVNQRYSVGEIEIQLSEQANPCGNLKILPYVGQERWPEFKKALQGRRGWYASVLKEGTISKGDLISRLE